MASVFGDDGGRWLAGGSADQALEAGERLLRLRQIEMRALQAVVDIGEFGGPAARFLRGQVTLGGRRTYLQDAWERLHPGESGWTWARANPYTAKLAFLEPDRRLDYIFVTPMRGDGRGTVRACRMVLHEPGPGQVFASDHFGLLAEIQVEPT